MLNLLYISSPFSAKMWITRSMKHYFATILLKTCGFRGGEHKDAGMITLFVVIGSRTVKIYKKGGNNQW